MPVLGGFVRFGLATAGVALADTGARHGHKQGAGHRTGGAPASALVCPGAGDRLATVKRRLISIAGAIGIALAAGGCGGDGNPGPTSKAVDFAYDMPGETKGGLTTMGFANAGAEPHEWALAQLSDGKTVENVERYLDNAGSDAPPPPWAKDVGGISAMTPGTEITVTRNLTAGNYAFICFLPGPGGKPHYKLGMIKGFQVTGSTDATPPTVDGSIVATADKAYVVTSLRTGHQKIELKNIDRKPRPFTIASYKPGKDMEDLRKWARRGFTGTAPADLYGSMQQVLPGEAAYLDMEIEPGKTYVVVDLDSGVRQAFKGS